MNRFEWFKLFFAVLLTLSAGAIGSFFTAPAISEWYVNLNMPALSPPNWLFGPVWTTLYILMGLATFLVWREGLEKRLVKVALVVYIIQLILNSLWSVIFFGAKLPGLALVEIGFLWLFIILNIYYFSKVSKFSAWLLVPYILWVSFAAYLNYQIWVLNV